MKFGFTPIPMDNEMPRYEEGIFECYFAKAEDKVSEKKGSHYIQVSLELQEGNRREYPFTSFPLWLSSEKAVNMSQGVLIRIDRLVNNWKKGDKEIAPMLSSEEMLSYYDNNIKGKKVTIELQKTGELTPKGNPRLGVYIEGVGRLYIPAKPQVDGMDYNYSDEDAPVMSEEDSIPF